MAGMTIENVFTSVLLELLDETFHSVHGNYLDRGTSLFETLESISPELASRPVSASCASLAAQVNHLCYYIDVLEQYVLGSPPASVDWEGSWRVGPVGDAEWDSLLRALESSYQRLLTTIQRCEDWSIGDRLGGVMNILVHSAYHLGEIRKALCTLAPEQLGV